MVGLGYWYAAIFANEVGLIKIFRVIEAAPPVAGLSGCRVTPENIKCISILGIAVGVRGYINRN